MISINNIAEKLSNDFKVYNNDIYYYGQIVRLIVCTTTTEGDIYKNAKKHVLSMIREEWDRGNFTWYVKYLNDNILGFDSREEAIKELHRLFKILEKWNLNITPYTLDMLLKSSYKLERLFDNILGGKEVLETEISKWSKNEYVIDILLNYASLRDLLKLNVDEDLDVSFSKSGNIVTDIINESRKIPLYTREEEREVFIKLSKAREELEFLKANDGDSKEITRLERKIKNITEDILSHNTRIVMVILKKYLGRGLDWEDLYQIGCEGLLKAITDFDVARGYRFMTYSAWWVRQKIARSVMDMGKTIRIPVNTSVVIQKIEKVKRDLEKEYSEVTNEMIAEVLNLPVDTVNEYMACPWVSNSLEDPISAEHPDSMIKEYVTDEESLSVEEQVISADLSNSINLALSYLDLREIFVLRMRFGVQDESNPDLRFCSSHTLEEVGRELGITRERVRQIEAKALRKLRAPKIKRMLSGDSEDYFGKKELKDCSQEKGRGEKKPAPIYTGRYLHEIIGVSQDKMQIIKQLLEEFSNELLPIIEVHGKDCAHRCLNEFTNDDKFLAYKIAISFLEGKLNNILYYDKNRFSEIVNGDSNANVYFTYLMRCNEEMAALLAKADKELSGKEVVKRYKFFVSIINAPIYKGSLKENLHCSDEEELLVRKWIVQNDVRMNIMMAVHGDDLNQRAQQITEEYLELLDFFKGILNHRKTKLRFLLSKTSGEFITIRKRLDNSENRDYYRSVFGEKYSSNINIFRVYYLDFYLGEIENIRNMDSKNRCFYGYLPLEKDELSLTFLLLADFPDKLMFLTSFFGEDLTDKSENLNSYNKKKIADVCSFVKDLLSKVNSLKEFSFKEFIAQNNLLLEDVLSWLTDQEKDFLQKLFGRNYDGICSNWKQEDFITYYRIIRRVYQRFVLNKRYLSEHLDCSDSLLDHVKELILKDSLRRDTFVSVYGEDLNELGTLEKSISFGNYLTYYKNFINMNGKSFYGCIENEDIDRVNRYLEIYSQGAAAYLRTIFGENLSKMDILKVTSVEVFEKIMKSIKADLSKTLFLTDYLGIGFNDLILVSYVIKDWKKSSETLKSYFGENLLGIQDKVTKKGGLWQLFRKIKKELDRIRNLKSQNPMKLLEGGYEKISAVCSDVEWQFLQDHFGECLENVQDNDWSNQDLIFYDTLLEQLKPKLKTQKDSQFNNDYYKAIVKRLPSEYCFLMDLYLGTYDGVMYSVAAIAKMFNTDEVDITTRLKKGKLLVDKIVAVCNNNYTEEQIDSSIAKLLLEKNQEE